MDHLRTIVVGVDFTPPSKVALEQALRIASWNRAAVKAAYVIDTIVTIELEAALSPMALQVQSNLVRESKSAWSEFAKGVAGAENVPFHCEVNNRAFGFLHYARDAHADLIVIGAYARKPEVGFGTMATACVRHAMSDVLIVRESQAGPFRKIVAAVDFSETSMRALERAIRLASQDMAALDVLHVDQTPWAELRAASMMPILGPADKERYVKGLEERLRAFCEPVKHELATLKARHVIESVEGHRSGLAAYAEREKADLLVLGTRGRSNLRDIVLGSTAEKALRSAHCSVLAVRPGT